MNNNNNLSSALVPILSEGTSCNVQLLHQKTNLDFEYCSPSPRQPSLSCTSGGESPTSVVPVSDTGSSSSSSSTTTTTSRLKEEDQPLLDHHHDWICHGTTILYLIHHSSSSSSSVLSPSKKDSLLMTTTTTTAADPISKEQPQYHSLALHFCPSHSYQIEDVQVYTIADTNNNDDDNSSNNNNENYHLVPSEQVYHLHMDPLRKILRSSSSLLSSSSSSSSAKYEADTQLSRGGSGFATSLRAAGIASQDGELKIAFSIPSNKNIITASSETNGEPVSGNNDDQQQQKQEVWKKDLFASSSTSHNVLEPQTDMLLKNLHSKTSHRRDQRIHLISKLLSNASSSKSKENNNTNNKQRNGQIPLKIIIRWTLASVPPNQRAAQRGLCIISSTLSSPTTPHLYTTSSYTRGWLPTIDNTFLFGKASHEMFLSVNANQEEGLSIICAGEDFVEDTIISYKKGHWKAIHMVASSTYEAIPCTCLGFAVGPFQFLLDPECLSSGSSWTLEEEDEVGEVKEGIKQPTTGDEGPQTITESDNNTKNKKRKKKTQKKPYSRKQGIIRQAFFAPLSMRSRIHSDYAVDDEENQNDDEFHKNLYHAFQLTITYSTSGVALRALHFCSTLLAGDGGNSDATRQLCSVYTQIWIPNAIDGGYAVGAPHQSNTHNSFVGGCIIDTRLLPPIQKKVPFYHGGRALQMAQARNVIWMWLKAGISIGSDSTNLSSTSNNEIVVNGEDVDIVGDGYISEVFCQYIMHLYEQAFGATGEGGSCHSMFYTPRYSDNADIRYPSLVETLLALKNIDDDDLDVDKLVGVGGAASEVVIVQSTSSSFVGASDDDSPSQSLYRNVSPSWSESRTSAADEAIVRSILRCDVLESLHNRSTTADKYPAPSMGWNSIGSLLSLTFLASQSTNATRCGCGVIDATHPTQMIYRECKAWWVAKISAARAGPDNLIRAIRACILAGALYSGHGWTCLPPEITAKFNNSDDSDYDLASHIPRFLLVIDELLKRGGITHVVYTKSLRLLAGPSKEMYLSGSLVDISKEHLDAKGNKNIIPEGFPNSYLRGASTLLLRVGVHVEPIGQTDVTSGSSQAKGMHLHVNAEPAIPSDGIAFGGPIHLRVVENENTCREFIRNLNLNSALCQWGPIVLYSNPVTSAKAQIAAFGHAAMDGTGPSKSALASPNASNKVGTSNKAGTNSTSESTLNSKSHVKETNVFKQRAYGVFTDNMLHLGGYQALELVRLTNRTPLLWCAMDPGGFYGGRIAISQPDACWGEMLFHDVNASGQIEAIRALAEKPSRIRGQVNVTSVFDVDVMELPVRLLGDCLRGSTALHSSIPHPPTIRAQAALAIAQWQNNKAPTSKDAVGANEWIGLKLLLQYFSERFTCSNSDGSTTVLPCKYTRETIQKAESGDYLYVDEIDKDEHDDYSAETRYEVEEDEEYRIRSAVITAISCIRAKDGQTPPLVIEFLETLLPVCDGAVFSSSSTKSFGNRTMPPSNETKTATCEAPHSAAISPEHNRDFPFIDPILVANTLLSLCNVNMRPVTLQGMHDDVVMGDVPMIDKSSTTSIVTDEQFSRTAAPVPLQHPIQKLLEICRCWLDWALYQETISYRFDSEVLTGIGVGFFSIISPASITALCSLALLKQSTSAAGALKNENEDEKNETAVEDYMEIDGADYPRSEVKTTAKSNVADETEEAATAQFYINILESSPPKSDITRAAAAQAVTCICCAADRFKTGNEEALGLLTSLEFLLDVILDYSSVSPELRQTLALLMMDACTGKVCSTHRVATLGGRNDLDVYRFSCGPLGSTYGTDIGCSMLLTVSDEFHPAANAVNDGARAGLKLLARCGLDSSTRDETVARVARFATKLWRVMNGEDPGLENKGIGGVCSNDPILRTTLLALWQWIYPKGCIAVIRVQSWRSMKGDPLDMQRCEDFSTNVMSISDEEKKIAMEEEASLSELQSVVLKEISRQQWRCDMSTDAYEILKVEANNDPNVSFGGVGQPLPVLNKDTLWRNGAWAASTAQQRREKEEDGVSSVTKIRLSVAAKSVSES